MHRFAVLFALGAVLSWSAGVQGVDCTDMMAEQAEKNKCLTKYGITSETDVDQLQTSIKTNLNSTCKDIEKYKSALTCAITISKDCKVSRGEDPNVIPDPKKVSEGVSYLCDHYQEIDSPCYQRVSEATSQCLVFKVQAAFSDPGEQDTTLVTCKTLEFSIDCMNQNLNVCPGKTLEVFVNYIQYFIPPACGGAPVLSGTAFVILSLAALIAITVGSSPDY
ncbi:uncharacterized protein [Littorina saxatilis]|uniref:Uncharacterized protein n=1 Tax=Littorina saxatilis TaxID=31220 RepID=A0AAN9AK40_9CAEN